MNPSRCHSAVLAGVTLLLATAVASAQPRGPVAAVAPDARSVWEYARQPGLRQAERDVLEAEVILLRLFERDRPPPAVLRLLELRRAHALLAGAVQRAPTFARGWIAFAETLDALGIESERAGNQTAARALFEQSLAATETSHALVGEGAEAVGVLFRLATLRTRLGHFEGAREAYRALLRLPTPRYARGVVLCNLAETHVYLGELEPAIELYRSCIDTRPDTADGWWGLASALDRDGQDGAAQDAAREAVTIDPELHDLTRDSVFFTPPYERHYYLALGREAQGRPHEAVAEWQRYLHEGGTQDRWSPRAEAHLVRLQAQLARDEDASARSTRRRATPRGRGSAPGTSPRGVRSR
jgi:tetratricopeptide (TPR) repeat protein